MFGIIWFVWHRPLVALPGGENAGFPLPPWMIAIVSMAVIDIEGAPAARIVNQFGELIEGTHGLK